MLFPNFIIDTCKRFPSLPSKAAQSMIYDYRLFALQRRLAITCLESLDEYEAAEKMHQQVLELKERVLGPSIHLHRQV